jgi:ParB-like chromosome segregation protein Spo0J
MGMLADGRLASYFREDPVMVPIALLHDADSPRLNGESAEHVHALAEAEATFPPILVHRATMRVIDGMHRVQAMIFSGKQEIKVQFFDGAEEDAFVAGVLANIAHGLPLSPADREAAASRILRTHPQWSDRAIAEVAGLASTTIAKIRGRSEHAQRDVRIGRDGRSRPVNGASRRRLAGQLYGEHPAASIREIALMAGISPATAKDVRDRMKRGEDPVPAKLALAEQKNASGPQDEVPRSTVTRSAIRGPQPHPALDPSLILQKLQRDPALRLNEDGRQLLRWLNARSMNGGDREGFEERIPAHCVSLVAELALGLAEEWARLAKDLQERAYGSSA